MPRKIIIVASIIVVAVAVVAYSQYVTNYPVSETAVIHSDAGLPINYTLKNYTVEKDLGSSCKKDNDCELPFEYGVMSRCPMKAICINDRCAVVCPGYKEIK